MTSPSPSAPRLIGIGGAHIDRRGQVAGPYVPGASNPGTMREDVGGVVFNALRTVRRRGLACSLLSIRGGDTAGDLVAREIADAGIEDQSAVFLDRATASYTALIDSDGDLIAGFADMGLYDLFPRQLRRAACREAIASADAVLCDANLPEAALRLVAEAAGDRPFHVIGISPAKVVRLANLVQRIDCLFVNRKEAVALARHLGLEDADPVAALRSSGLRGAVVTDGAAPLIGFDARGAFAIQPPRLDEVADVTGAGDALAGATVAALTRALVLGEAAREGVAAALLALRSPLAVPVFDDASFAAALALVPSPSAVA
jgi:sugar/nucleoside kinase (ribokinase family)